MVDDKLFEKEIDSPEEIMKKTWKTYSHINAMVIIDSIWLFLNVIVQEAFKIRFVHHFRCVQVFGITLA